MMAVATPAAAEAEAEEEEENLFGRLSDDVVLNILFKMEEDPRQWSRIACVSRKFSSLVRNICWKSACLRTLPSSLLPPDPDPNPDYPNNPSWSSLHKLTFCCPGLLHSGLLFDNSDFGLLRDLGPDPLPPSPSPYPLPSPSASASSGDRHPSPDRCWTLFDDLYNDTVYSNCDDSAAIGDCGGGGSPRDGEGEVGGDLGVVRVGKEAGPCKRRKLVRSMRSHMASGARNLCREQGNKLLASRFRGDCLYICDWPGCVHIGDKRKYMLFRGFFRDFKRSGVWRTINDGNQRSRTDLNCAFCSCNQTWDLHSSFCLRRVFGYHDDGEPVVRAYVCENGHVSGAWTDQPLYT